MNENESDAVKVGQQGMNPSAPSGQGIGFVILATNGYFLLGLRLIKMLQHHYKGRAQLNIYLFSDRSGNNYFHDLKNIHHIPTSHDGFVTAVSSSYSILKSMSQAGDTQVSIKASIVCLP